MMKTNRRGAADEDFDDAFDERGVLKQHDQHGQLVRARVPMMLRDAAARDDRREVQRQIKADAAARDADRQRIHDGTGNPYALHRPARSATTTSELDYAR